MTVSADISIATGRTRSPIQELYGGQPFLAGVGLLCVLMMIPTFAALALDGRTLNGISVWIKPLKFQASLAVQLLTVAWLMRWLPEQYRQTRLISLMAALMAGAALFEIAYISHQASLGAGSHFNVGTPYTRFMYGLMGVGSVVLVGTAGAIGALILRYGEKRDPMVIAAGLGLILGSGLGLVTGVSLSLHHAHWVGGIASDAGGLPIVGWSRTGGDLRVAHFFGLHMMQAVPMAALIARRFGDDSISRAAVWVTAALGIIVTAATYAQAWRGLPLLPA